MGLDTYFHKCKRAEYNDFKEKEAQFNKLSREEQDKAVSPYDNFDPEEIGYFRKVNFLMSFFDYHDNCEYQTIDIGDLYNLREICTTISKMNPKSVEDRIRCAELLPTQSGFFFGNTEYDEYYFNDVEIVLEWLNDVLPTIEDDDVVLMWCWW